MPVYYRNLVLGRIFFLLRTCSIAAPTCWCDYVAVLHMKVRPVRLRARPFALMPGSFSPITPLLLPP
jgi:hypothetical protein